MRKSAMVREEVARELPAQSLRYAGASDQSKARNRKVA